MGRCETLIEVSTQQIESLAGGRLLRAETMSVQNSTMASISAGNKPAPGVISADVSNRWIYAICLLVMRCFVSVFAYKYTSGSYVCVDLGIHWYMRVRLYFDLCVC